MKVCFVSSYYSKDYVRGSFILGTLEEIDEIDLYVAKNRSRGVIRYYETLKEVVKIRFKENPDIYLISFRGHEIFPFIRLIGLGKVIIFDTLVSPYHALNKESKLGVLGELTSYFLYPLEAMILHLSNVILTDTNLHKDFYSKTFKINKKKIERIFVGSQTADSKLPRYKPNPQENTLSVFFYGNFLPLHGIEYILESAKRLKNEQIQFYLVGGNEEVKTDLEMFISDNDLNNIDHTSWMELNDLFAKARKSDVCLGGPFGGTDQARRVITGKAYQFLNLGVATIIGKIDEEVGFIDKSNCLLVDQADPEQLSEAILWCKENKKSLGSIGRRGKELYEKQFSTEAQKSTMLDILKKYE